MATQTNITATDTVSAVAAAVAEVASAVTAYSPNDVGKAVNAAKRAGNTAKKIVGKEVYPEWDWNTKKGKPVAESLGMSKGEYQTFRGREMQSAYNDAYQQVWLTYQNHIEAMTNQVNNFSSQDILDNAVASDTAANAIGAIYGDQQTSKGAFGCASVAILLVVSSVLLLTLI